MSDYRTVDLFCGCGGMSLGFQRAGFNIIAAYDNWQPAINVYEQNFSHPAYKRDLEIGESQREVIQYRPRFIIGGPPCQDFSTAGHMDEGLGRAQLSIAFSNIVIGARPEYFVMENVTRARTSKAYQKAISQFVSAGYGITKIILDACYCNVPQRRKRYFVIGHLEDEDDFLKSYLLSHLSEKPMTIHDYLGDELGTEYYFRVPTNYSRRGVYSIYEPAMTIRGIDRPIPKGYKKHPQDPVEIGPLVRSLTIKERSYLQTFPKNFKFEGTKTDINTMIGNAVPINLAQYVAEALMSYALNLEKGGD